ncbi:N-acyl amino acid synthase FeeM domain-containing protein [Rhodocyclaceae bacterium SMB388]
MINPDFAFVRDGYHIRLANGAPHLQTQIGRLIGDMYGSRGLQAYTTVSSTAGPEQVTLAACTGDKVFGTLTLGVDTGSGLLADTLYRDEINRVRAGGGRVGEVTRLALDPELSSPDVMAHIFNITFLLARQIHRVTDLFVEVHPRHAGFYQRMMGYRVAGPVRTCPRVNAPAVLLHLCLDYAEQQISRLAGRKEPGDRSMYRRCLSPIEQHSLLQNLVTRVPMAA